MNSRTLVRAGTMPVVVGIAAVCLTPAVSAQDAEEPIEELVVVGSRGEGRDPLQSMVPVDVIGADQMQQVATLGGELGELLQALAPSFSFPRQSASGSVEP